MDSMDGTKRKRDSLSLIDLGTTPPWSLPASLYEESSLRSTQDHANDTNSVQPQFLAEAQHEDGEDDEEYEPQVDLENDGVYMINASEGSWSGSLPAEDDPAEQARLPYQAEIALAHLRRAQEITKQQQSIAKANATIEAILEENKWKKDLLLRNTIRRIKKQLQEGGVLVLERLNSDLVLSCAHAHCPAPGQVIPAEAYYITVMTDHESKITYCLFCLESLWNGIGIIGTLDEAKVTRLDGVEQLDGIAHLDGLPHHQPLKPSPLSQTHFQIPDSLLSSKHAPSGGELSALLTRECNTPGSPVSNEDSVTSDGEWRNPPTRFQHLYGFIKPGSSLGQVEKAAVELWKEACEEQIQWEKFREKYAENVETLNGGSDGEDSAIPDDWEDSGALEAPKVDGDVFTSSALGTVVQKQPSEDTQRKDSVQDNEDGRQLELETTAGVSKRECRGKNLTAVLADVRSRQNG